MTRTYRSEIKNRGMGLGALATSLVECAGVAGAALLILSVSPVYAAGSETVNCNAPGADLQKKLDAAHEGSTVFVTGHCVNGPFTIDRDINLSGFDGAMLSAAEGSGSVLYVRGRTNISNIGIAADGIPVGVLANGGASLVLDRVTVDGATSSGVFVGFGGGVQVFDSEFRYNAAALRLSSSGGYISNSTFEQNVIGVSVQHGGGVSITNGTIIDGNDTGIVVRNNATAQVSDSTIINSASDGISIILHGMLDFGAPNNFGGSGGADVNCESRGVITVGPPQLPNGGATSIDPSCLVFGTIFLP